MVAYVMIFYRLLRGTVGFGCGRGLIEVILWLVVGSLYTLGFGII
jgi:hypothetical protein